MSEDKQNIAMFGQKHMLSREGGVEIVVKELATRMAAKGNTVICYDRKSRHVSGSDLDLRREFNGVSIIPVWTVGKKGWAAVTSSISAALKICRSNADIVHIHAEGPAAMCGFIKTFGKKTNGKKKRVIVTIHGLDWQRAKWGRFARNYIRAGEKSAVKHADEIIVLSHGVQNYFKSTYNRDTVFIPNGISKPEIREADEIKKLWGLEKDSYVLFLGRIVPEKGISYLLEAWKGIETNKKLVIAGGSSDTQAYMDELKAMCAGNDNVIFTGFQQGRVLEELYSNAYIYCLPSDLEGMPLSLLEAMSYGNCCVVSDISECSEVVEDKAVLFRKSDIKDLKRVLQDLVDDETKVAKYKQSASGYITMKYNWDKVVDKTLDLYVGN